MGGPGSPREKDGEKQTATRRDYTILGTLAKGPCGHKELRKKTGMRVCDRLIDLESRGLIEIARAGVGRKERISLTGEGSALFMEGDPEAASELLEGFNTALENMLRDPRELLALRRWQWSSLVKDGGYNPDMWGYRERAGMSTENFLRLMQPAVLRNRFTPKEARAITARLDEVMVHRRTLALALRAYLLLESQGLGKGGRVPACVWGLDGEGRLLAIPVASLKEKGIGMDLADHVE